MRTIILGNYESTQKVLDHLTYENDNVTKICRSRNCSYATFKNNDYIKCLLPNEKIRGEVADVIYVPCTMTIDDVRKYSAYLSHGRDIEVIVYKIRKLARS